jgi:hypothetical protein
VLNRQCSTQEILRINSNIRLFILHFGGIPCLEVIKRVGKRFKQLLKLFVLEKLKLDKGILNECFLQVLSYCEIFLTTFMSLVHWQMCQGIRALDSTSGVVVMSRR